MEDETQKFQAVEEDKSGLLLDSLLKVIIEGDTQDQLLFFESTRGSYTLSSEDQITKNTIGIDDDGALIFMSDDYLDGILDNI